MLYNSPLRQLVTLILADFSSLVGLPIELCVLPDTALSFELDKMPT